MTALARPVLRVVTDSDEPSDPPAALSDDALLAACGAGDATALGALFDRHHEAVYRLTSRLMRGEPSEIDDLVQTTFLEALRGAKRFAGRGSVKSYLFGIAANTVRRHRRRSHRQRAAYASWQPPRGADTPEVETLRAQQLSRLSTALDALPDDLRAAYVLCDLEGIPGVEAARMLNARAGTLGRWLHEARRALRAAIEGGAP